MNTPTRCLSFFMMCINSIARSFFFMCDNNRHLFCGLYPFPLKNKSHHCALHSPRFPSTESQYRTSKAQLMFLLFLVVSLYIYACMSAMSARCSKARNLLVESRASWTKAQGSRRALQPELHAAIIFSAAKNTYTRGMCISKKKKKKHLHPRLPHLL